MMIFLMAGRDESAWGTFRYNFYILSYVFIYVLSQLLDLFSDSIPPIPLIFFMQEFLWLLQLNSRRWIDAIFHHSSQN